MKLITRFNRGMMYLFLLVWGQAVYANVVGGDFQNFNPTTNGIDFVTVQSSETLDPWVMNFGYFVNYSVNTLPYFEDASSIQNRSNYNDSILYGDLNIGLGLSKNWDVGINLPHLIDQNVDSDFDHGEFENRGLTELRLNTKYRFFGDDTHGLATVLSTDFNMVDDNPYLGKNAGFVTVLELVGDMTLGRFAVGTNLGYRFRQAGSHIDPDIEPYGDSFIASLAASYLFPSIDTKIITEVFAGWPSEGRPNNTSREESSAEALIGLKYDRTTNLSFHIGASTELFNGSASPDLRLYAGLNYAIGPLIKEKPKPTPAPEIISEDIAEVEEVDEDLPEIEQIEKGEIYKLAKVEFKFASSYRAVGEAKKELDAVANRVLEKGYTEIVVAGHTDSVGSESYNKKLSLQRAKTVERYLVENHNIKTSEIRSMGFGESLPIADNGNYQGRQKNRRVEVIVMQEGKWPGYASDYGYQGWNDPEPKVVVEKKKKRSKKKKLPTRLPRKLPPKKN
ncbi:MAG: OmpA family protein [Bdellovibrionales bacterium]|nr:OmpA family protein [Bdellovibrionales bacterium]